jgi:hypothetical protein
MNRTSYLDAGNDLLPRPELRLVTALALVGIGLPVVAVGAWGYAASELRKVDDGTLCSYGRRSIDHARVLAKTLSIAYLFVAVILIGFHP